MISTVAVGTDGSPTAAEAVKMAAEMAQRFGAELVLLSAFQESVPPSEPDELQWASSSSARTREILARAEGTSSATGSCANCSSIRATRLMCWSASRRSAGRTFS